MASIPFAVSRAASRDDNRGLRLERNLDDELSLVIHVEQPGLVARLGHEDVAVVETSARC
jgi:hypothetical protein